MSIAVLKKKPDLLGIEDVQGRADTRQIPINLVGVKDINHAERIT